MRKRQGDRPSIANSYINVSSLRICSSCDDSENLSFIRYGIVDDHVRSCNTLERDLRGDRASLNARGEDRFSESIARKERKGNETRERRNRLKVTSFRRKRTSVVTTTTK